MQPANSRLIDAVVPAFFFRCAFLYSKFMDAQTVRLYPLVTPRSLGYSFLLYQSRLNSLVSIQQAANIRTKG